MRSLEIVGNNESQGMTKSGFMLNSETVEHFKNTINKKLKRKVLPSLVKNVENEKESLKKVEKIEKHHKMELKNILN